MKRATAELTVGAFVLLAGLALLFLALRVSGLTDEIRREDGYQVKAYFQNITGLTNRARVTMSGVPVGQVQAIRLDPQRYDAEVVIHFDKNVRITKDANASIQTAGFLGEKFIAISQGADEQFLKNNDVLDITQTQSTLVLEDLIGKFLFNKATAAPASPDGDNAAASVPAVTPAPAF